MAIFWFCPNDPKRYRLNESNCVEIRNIEIVDYNRLIHFWTGQEGIHLNDADSQENMDRYLKRNPGMSFMAVDQEIIVGTALAGHDGRRGYLFHVGVDKNYRGTGIGHKLLEHCYSALRDAGITKCYVFLLKDNEEGQRYWLKEEWSATDEFNLMSKLIVGSRAR